ncbi:DUF2505 domain-containing protein [Actinotignum urinale]|uniref:DUF2505 domain-containing protein n=1 Tax=Actinotignum urinale TaxID=190146 RepID=A0ABU5GD27_9ACTO|nr:DUF2505 domain-containing protein [Actinotignum urinale]MDY5133523.1 DUF2505 domain-containing protein [Actinotignum urinale]
MNFSDSYGVATPTHKVLDALISPQLMEKRMKELSVSSYSFTQSDNELILHFEIPTDKLPAMATKLLADNTDLDIPFLREGSRVVSDINPPKLPGSARIVMDVCCDDENSSTVTVSGYVKVGIPFFGKKVEQLIVEHVGKVISLDADIVRSIVTDTED